VKVEVSPTARRQLPALAAWWRENRSSSRARVDDALEAAITGMSEHPGLGPTYSRDPRYRTWRLRGTPYVLFYRVDEPAETIWIVVAWSALRGSGPELP
jgi:plasmid stabilization system protein ParE